ncbi:MAG: SDR family NAD(P)-dependent oxidoreductase [Candidatus Hodarchaeota archaeon]
MGLFDDKVVVITGAGRGIGRAHALGFAREGAKVVVNDLGTDRDGSGSSGAIADKVVEEITDFEGTAVANYDTVATIEGGRSIIQTAIDTYGRLDVLVNNAGFLRRKSLLKMTEDIWDQILAVHLKGTFSCTQAAAQVMCEQKEGGSIINTTSMAGFIGEYSFNQANYGAAKAGIIGFTIAAAFELERYNINVNAIAPVAIGSILPETVTPVVLFLASDRARHITGKVVGVHGRTILEYRILPFTVGITKESWTVEDIATKFATFSVSGNRA